MTLEGIDLPLARRIALAGQASMQSGPRYRRQCIFTAR